MAKKTRLDTLLVENGYFETKNRAQSAVMAGDVKINGETITKAGAQLCFDGETQVEITSMKYVSRGGYKLEKALVAFGLSPDRRVCLDAGASTGGFTDCLLQNGAKFVYAVDVGYGQIAWKLRQDARVKVIERTNIKNCTLDDVYVDSDVKPDFCVMDLSFISIKRVLENVKKLLVDNCDIVALIKPQFEAGKNLVGKNGVVRDKSTHLSVVDEVMIFAKSLGLCVADLTFSPIKGPAGNIEYLVWLTTSVVYKNINPSEVVDAAFLTL